MEAKGASKNARRSDAYSALMTAAGLAIASANIKVPHAKTGIDTEYCSLNDAAVINTAPNTAHHNLQTVQVGTLRIRDANKRFLHV